MEESISPIEGRYKDAVAPLRKYLGEHAFYSYRIKVEVSYFDFFIRNVQGRQLTEAEMTLLRKISDNSEDDVEIIKKIENSGHNGRPATRHDVKAIEYFVKDSLRDSSLEDAVEVVHFGMTSEDVNNIAYGIMLSKALHKEINPSLRDIYNCLAKLSLKYKDVAMLSRTHNQPASPTTVGKEFANFAERIKRQINNIENQKISVKLNGATGNYNALVASYPKIDWPQFSINYIESVSRQTSSNLECVLMTTQIVPADSYAELFNTIKLASVILQGFCQDIWEYIGREYFVLKCEKGAIGSSTMPHKINPIKFENAEGNYKKTKHLCNLITEELPISRQQRDLSDSTIKREFGDILSRFYMANKSLIEGLSRIEINQNAITEELNNHPEVIAEGIQTILRREGVEEPYEKIKELTLGGKINLEELRTFINKLEIPQAAKEEITALSPEKYTGLASQLVDKYST